MPMRNLLAATISAALASSSTAQFLFDDVRFDPETGATELVTADVDRDGDPDLILLSRSNDLLSVRRNGGDASFTFREEYGVGDAPFALVVDLINDDAWPDIVTLNDGDGTVTVLINDGTGGYSEPRHHWAGEQPEAMAVGDFNGDGHADIVVAARVYVQLEIVILTNDREGGFRHETLESDTMATGLAVGDFDADGDVDIAAARTYHDSIRILVNDGEGVFDEAVELGFLDTPHRLDARDVNGDGHLDLVAAHVTGTPSLSVLLGTGDGSFLAPRPYPLHSTQDFVVRDLDGDGDVDIAVTGHESVAVLRNRGDGSFEPAVDRPITGEPVRVAAADYDGDGDVDVMTLQEAGVFAMLVNPGAVIAATRHVLPITTEAHDVTVAHINHDAWPDLVVGGGTNNLVSVYAGRARGELSPPNHYALMAQAGLVIVEDMDDDGDSDIIVTDRFVNDSFLAVLRNGGDGTFAAEESSPIGKTYWFALGDLDGDGDLDAATLDSRFDDLILVENVGDGVFRLPSARYELSDSPSGIVLARMDDDTHLDALIVTRSDDRLWLFPGHGDMTFGAPRTWLVGDRPGFIATGDIDGDGDLDVAVSNDVSADVTVLFNDGDGEFIGIDTYPISLEPRQLELRDVDLDDDLDLVVLDSWQEILNVLSNDGNGAFGSPIAYGIGPSVHDFELADMDLDGDLDVVLSTGGAMKVHENLLVNAPFCPADVDGDGFVNARDLHVVLAQWGPCPPECPGDVDGDGDVSYADVLRILAAWGACSGPE